ncbi:MAG TPA: hypothetical protein VFG34_10315 [Sphingopyxis sp.]|nr:hypothetical protein [Sphingopyxis sp.]
MRRFHHFAALDWSGARGERQQGIALAIASGDAAPQLVRPGHRWSRMEICDWIAEQARLKSDLLIGFDFSSALPFHDHGSYFPSWPESPQDARALWALVERLSAEDPHLEATSFLQHPEIHRHFRHGGGIVGDLFEGGGGRLRFVEHYQRQSGQASSISNLSLVGPAQVGKASLTGMRMLHRLHSIVPLWPLDPLPDRGPAMMESYTSLAARAAGLPKGRSKIRTGEALNEALAALHCPPTPHHGPISDHQSDALLTAAWIRLCASQSRFWTPPALTPEIAAQEGWTFGII